MEWIRALTDLIKKPKAPNRRFVNQDWKLKPPTVGDHPSLTLASHGLWFHVTMFQTKTAGPLPDISGTNRTLNIELQPALKEKTDYTWSLLVMSCIWQVNGSVGPHWFTCASHLWEAVSHQVTQPEERCTVTTTKGASSSVWEMLNGEYYTLLSPNTGAFLSATTYDARARPAF